MPEQGHAWLTNIVNDGDGEGACQVVLVTRLGIEGGWVSLGQGRE